MHTQEEIENSKLELAESLSRLYKNKDFKKIVQEGYLENGAVFLTKNLKKVKTDIEPAIIEEMAARSIFWRYLDGIEEEARSILEARMLDGNN